MPDFLKKFKVTPVNVLKLAGAAVLALIILAFALQLLVTSFKTITGEGISGIAGMVAPSYGGYGVGGGYAGDYAYDSFAGEEAANMGMPSLSVRNVAQSISPPMQPSPTGDSAEDYEVTSYSANIETRRLEETCATVASLKVRTDVIFENANSYDRGCNFTFKVKHESVEQILATLEALDPKELSENTYTIKRQIDDYTNEVDVLQKKRASIDQTLASALNAYDEITRLATNTQNADALAKIINSKIELIERMTVERININEQLDRLARAKADQLDRLDYTYFSVNVYENKFIDGEQLKDSWKDAIKNFVRDMNAFAQDLTVNLLLLLLFIAQWLIYAAIALVVAKYGWKVAKYIWLR